MVQALAKTTTAVNQPATTTSRTPLLKAVDSRGIKS